MATTPTATTGAGTVGVAAAAVAATAMAAATRGRTSLRTSEPAEAHRTPRDGLGTGSVPSPWRTRRVGQAHR